MQFIYLPPLFISLVSAASQALWKITDNNGIRPGAGKTDAELEPEEERNKE